MAPSVTTRSYDNARTGATDHETVLSAISNSLSHLAGHTQEVVYITRLQLGDAYQFAWVPRTPEQGAPQEATP